jgi:cytochrome P450
VKDAITQCPVADWDPRADAVLDDQIAVYDHMRRTCPVAHSEFLQWSVFRHADVVQILNDPDTFSSQVSAHMSVPNGMDPPRHTEYRRVVESYFTPAYIDAYEPVCRDIAVRLARALPQGEVELMGDFAQTFALRMQSAYLGWPQDLHEPLRLWINKNRQATLKGERSAMAAIAFEFDGYIKGMLAVRRQAGADAPADITSSLLNEKVNGRPLSDDEIVSILRNWTVGELSTMASCVGIIAHYLALKPPVQTQLRAQPSLLPAAIDEILRMQAPLIANRRIVTRPVSLGGRQLQKGDRLSLIWASANRDEAVFGDPDEFRLDRDAGHNLLYGKGIHICPGAPLARLQLRHITEQLLAHTRHIGLVPGKSPKLAVYPAGGFSVLPLSIA